MILWCKKILANDCQLNDVGPIIFALYLFIGFRRKRKRGQMCVLSHFNHFSHDVTFLHFWKISENLNTRSEKSQPKWLKWYSSVDIYIYMVYNYPWSLDTEEQFLMSRPWQGCICLFFCYRRKVRQDKVCIPLILWIMYLIVQEPWISKNNFWEPDFGKNRN